ncbi:hypothetical protein E5843_00755 [Luteimonas yindakuii]|uniref:hypothetical protein n=1 Tax=Luteimonas yindakuii TaxID=2565782 RepID=UPI0010A473EC|nr:hypothetical protein [Luteimonas yindakuii]QCO66689.1 hypothetical protein E5843_00755 [Luteimonas yindakuii]
MRKDTASPLRFQPRLAATAFHLLLLAAVLALFAGRKPGLFRSRAILDLLPGFYSHVSNFALSYLFFTGVGFAWLMTGVRVHALVLAALVLCGANVAYELLLPLLNTRDPMDAVHGVAGTLLGLAWLLVLRRFGLRRAPDSAA